jgi:hypothetical protein
VSPSGTLVLAQPQDNQVRFFGPSGETRGAFGSEGDGPGGFRFPSNGGWAGDTLWIGDLSLGRVTLVSPEGELVRTHRSPAVVGPWSAPDGRALRFAANTLSAVLPDGTFLAHVRSPIDAGPSDRKAGTPILRIDAEGSVLNHVATAPSIEDIYVLMSIGDGAWITGYIPFHHSGLWTMAHDGSRVAVLDLPTPDGSAFHVGVFAATGDTLLARTYPVEPAPIPTAVIDSAIEANVARREPSQRADMAALIRDEVPTHYPPGRDIIIGSDRRIWVRLHDAPEGHPWVALSETGEPVGRVVLPPGSGLRAANETHLWTVEQDELGIGSVVRYRMGDGR